MRSSHKNNLPLFVDPNTLSQLIENTRHGSCKHNRLKASFLALNACAPRKGESRKKSAHSFYEQDMSSNAGFLKKFDATMSGVERTFYLIGAGAYTAVYRFADDNNVQWVCRILRPITSDDIQEDKKLFLSERAMVDEARTARLLNSLNDFPPEKQAYCSVIQYGQTNISCVIVPFIDGDALTDEQEIKDAIQHVMTTTNYVVTDGNVPGNFRRSQQGGRFCVDATMAVRATSPVSRRYLQYHEQDLLEALQETAHRAPQQLILSLLKNAVLSAEQPWDAPSVELLEWTEQHKDSSSPITPTPGPGRSINTPPIVFQSNYRDSFYSPHNKTPVPNQCVFKPK